VEKITITATEVDIRQDCNMSTSNTSTSNALVANMSQANASNMSLINLSADLITGDISPNLTAGTGISLSTTTGVTTINNTATGTSQLYYFRATSNLGGNQTINTNTILLYNDFTYDVPSGNYNTTLKRYVVPIAGTWQFFFQAYQNSSVSTGFRLGIYKNGTQQVQTGGSVGNSERGGVILECAVGDYIDIRGSAGSANVFMEDEFSWFEGYLLAGSSQLSTSTQYAWRASSTSSGTASLSAGTRINYNSITNNAVRDFETPSGAGNYKTGTKEYQAPVAGYYLIGFNILVNTGSTDCQVNLKKTTSGGTTSALAQSGKQNKSTEDCITISYLDVGDKVFVEVVSGTISLDYNTAGTYFYGNLLQPENNTITDTTDLTTNSLTTSTTNVSNSNISNLTIDNNLNGYAFIRTICIAKVLANGTNVKTIGCTISRSNTGRYACVLDVARPSSDYCVQLTSMETSATLDDCIIHVTEGSMTTTGFLYVITEQDNGGSPGTYRDRNHFVTVFDTD